MINAFQTLTESMASRSIMKQRDHVCNSKGSQGPGVEPVVKSLPGSDTLAALLKKNHRCTVWEMFASNFKAHLYQSLPLRLWTSL